MADAPALILTTVEVDTKTGIASLKQFEKQVDDTAAAAKKSLGKMDDGLSPLRELLQKSRTDTAALETQIASMGKTAEASAAAAGGEFLFMAGAVAAAAIGIAGTVAAVEAFAAAAQPISGVRQGFETLTAQAGETADTFLTKLRPATQGLVSDIGLMKATNAALVAELPLTSEKLAEVARMTTLLSRAYGIDAEEALNKFISGSERQSTRLLAGIGVIVRATDAYKAYADQIGVTSDDLTAQERVTAFTNAAIESMRQRTEGMQVPLNTLSQNVHQVNTEFVNAKNAILDFVNVKLGDSPAEQLARRTLTAADVIEGLGRTSSLSPVAAQADELARAIDRDRIAFEALAKAQGALKAGPDFIAEGNAVFEAQARLAELAAQKVDTVVSSLKKDKALLEELQHMKLETTDAAKTSAIDDLIEQTKKKIKAIEDPMAAHREKDLADEARYQEQLLQIAVAAAGKGTAEREALEEAAISVRFDHEIAAARARGEAVDALEAARDQARQNKRQAAADDTFKASFADDAKLAQAHLQNDLLSWQQRQGLEERSLSDQFEIAVKEYDRQGKDTAKIFEAYQAAIDGIARKHSETRTKDAIDDEIKLAAALGELAKAQEAGAIQATEPAPRRAFSAAPSLQQDIDLAEKRKQIALAALDVQLDLEAQRLDLAWAKEQVDDAANLDKLKLGRAKYETDITALVLKGETQRRAITNATTKVEVDATNLRLMTNLQATQQMVTALQGAFAGSKAFALALGQINIALAITEVWADPTTSNYYVKIAQSVALAAAGAAQIAQMQSATPGSGTVVSPSGGSATGTAGAANYSNATTTPTRPDLTGTTPVVTGTPPPQQPPPAVVQQPIIIPTQTPIVVMAPQSATAPLLPSGLPAQTPTRMFSAAPQPSTPVFAQPSTGSAAQSTPSGTPTSGDIFNVTITVDAMTFAELLRDPKNLRALVEKTDQYRSRS